MKPRSLAILVMVCALVRAAGLNACDCTGLHSGLPWFAYGYSGSLYGLGYVPVPPYYALHPPVYYSHPAARPYGDSPFAASPRSPRPSDAAPRLMANPFVRVADQTGAESPPAGVSAMPAIITNPHCKSQ